MNFIEFVDKYNLDISTVLHEDMSYDDHDIPEMNERRLRMRYYAHLTRLKSEILYQFDMNFDVAVYGLDMDNYNRRIGGPLENILPQVDVQLKFFQERMGYTDGDMEALEEWYA